MPGQGKFKGIIEHASSTAKGITFTPEVRFHRVEDLLQEKGIPPSIQAVLQCVDPQLRLMCGQRQPVMASFCKESIANVGAKIALQFLDSPAHGNCMFSFLKALHLDFMTFRVEFIPQFLLIRGHGETLNVQHWKERNAQIGSPPVDLFLYVEQDEHCAIAMLSTSQACSTAAALSHLTVIEEVNIERKGASPGTFLQSVIDAKVHFPNFSLIFEGNELAVHFCGHTVPCGLYFGQQELLQLFLTPFFPDNYAAAKVLSPTCNLSEEWLSEVLRDFSCSAKLASPCRQAVHFTIDPEGVQ